ncbi:hypothetical protein [Nonomuraea solani]|uniref:hypothetical protein n=1 Tax=Nonomuraea solani TaxID=1144553 RepID=UPI0011B09D79|nr:hypothetical protein [Nonomuraea solani]
MSQISGRSLALSTALVVAAISFLYGTASLAVGWFWAAKPLETDPGAILQIQEIGSVTARTETRFTESDSVIVTKYLIIASNTADPSKAVVELSRALQSENWETTAEISSTVIQMKSKQWPNHLLSLEIPDEDSLSLHGDKVQKALRQAKATARFPDSLVTLSLRRTDV